MKILSSESFKTIEPLIPENYGNLHGRLRQRLTPEESSIFAFPDFPTANSGQWVTDADKPLRTFSEAPQGEKEEISAFLEVNRSSILEKLSDMSFARSLFTVPSEDQIFWYRGDDGRMRVVMAQWGFRFYRRGADVDIVDTIISMPREMVLSDAVIHVLYSDDKPACDAGFTLNAFNNTKRITTDGEGLFHLGTILSGLKFSVADDSGRLCEFAASPQQKEYIARFDLYVPCTVKVINQNGDPMSGYRLTVEGAPVSTGEDGVASVEKVLLTPGGRLTVRDDAGQTETYAMSRTGNDFEFHIHEQFYTSCTVRVINQKGEPKPGFRLYVDGREFMTDGQGVAAVGDIPYCEGAVVTVRSASGGEQTYNLSMDAAANDFIHQVVDREVRIRIFDTEGRPLDCIEVLIDTKGCGTLSSVTDSEGYALFPFDAFEDGEKPTLRFHIDKAYMSDRKKRK